MQSAQPYGSVFRVEPPPLWFVTNGELTVGPVVTGLLMRGIEAGRVPEYCHVRIPRGSWRRLNGVREVAAMSKVNAKAPTPEQLAEWGPLIDRTKDALELAHTVAWLALVATGAESAMLHCREGYAPTLTTRAVVGPMSNERFGYALPESDPILRSARLGCPVFGPPFGPIEDALAKRFASTRGGVGAVAMVPGFIGKELIVMLELARPGHAFRRSDLQRAERIVQRALRKRTN
jgi:hypothetical protein